jgi:hypothetical protein
VAKPDFAQCRFCSVAHVGAFQSEPDIAPHPLPRQQPRILEDDRTRRRDRHVLCFGGIESRERPQQRRLARPRTAEQRDEFALHNLEMEIVEHGIGAETAREA